MISLVTHIHLINIDVTIQVTQRLEAAALMSTSPANVGHRLITPTTNVASTTTHIVVSTSNSNNNV